eukprot:TRINITY_DN11306_c0_g8_i1.p1 TRINITY_DN11306_c0_g8~~TRINITY_DN11306_c0_g8_i1.p1  ORF type:complete len:417 (-),score=61.69 TRINITY_DN11306_c0_g8_i1:705-1955(-)
MVEDLPCRKEEGFSPERKSEASPELRYMSSPNDEPVVSPYDKSISTEEIRQRISQSLQQQSFSRETSKKPLDASELGCNGEVGLLLMERGVKSGVQEKVESEGRVAKGKENVVGKSKYEKFLCSKRQQNKNADMNTFAIPKSGEVLQDLPLNASQELLAKFLETQDNPLKQVPEDKLLTQANLDLIEERFHTTNTILEQFVDLTTIKESSSRQPKELHNRLEEAFETLNTLLIQSKRKMSIEEQSLKYAECINDANGDIRLGAIVGCYIILKSFPKEIVGVIGKVLQNIFTQLIHFESQEQAFIIAALELIGLIGANEISCNAVSIVRAILLSAENYSELQVTCVNTLVLVGYPGLRTLIDVINKGSCPLQQAILSRLCSIPLVQVTYAKHSRNTYSFPNYSTSSIIQTYAGKPQL